MLSKLQAYQRITDQLSNHLRWFWLFMALSIIFGLSAFNPDSPDLTVAYIALGIGAGYNLLVLIALQRQKQSHEEEIKDLRMENRQAEIIYQMATTLGVTLNYQRVLKSLADLTYDAVASSQQHQARYHAVVMVLVFQDEEKLALLESRNVPKIDDNRTVSSMAGILEEVTHKVELVLSTQIKQDPILKSFVALQKCRSLIAAPLRVGLDTFGVILAASPMRDAYDEEHLALLELLASQAAVAMQNAQLYDDLAEEQRKLLEKEAQARHELARNLHDGPTQALATIAMRLNFVRLLLQKNQDVPKSIDEVIKIEKIVAQTTKMVRNMLFTLRPVVLETQGLVPAIEQYADRLKDSDNLNIKVNVESYGRQLSTRQEGVLFAIYRRGYW